MNNLSNFIDRLLIVAKMRYESESFRLERRQLVCSVLITCLYVLRGNPVVVGSREALRKGFHAEPAKIEGFLSRNKRKAKWAVDIYSLSALSPCPYSHSGR